MGNIKGSEMFHFVPGQRYTFRFLNYRSEWETRHVIFQGMDYGRNEYYPQKTWLLRCYDLERGEPRSFTLTGIDPTTIAEAA